MNVTEEIEFKGWRKYLWPVHGSEFKVVFLLSIMMFGILFNYTILRDIKDIFILTADCCGSEAMSFIKAWGTVPVSLILMSAYARLSLSVSKAKLFYITLAFFVLFFATFNYIILPNASAVHASKAWMESANAAYPKLRYIIPLVGNWSFSLFYILSEVWGSIGLSVLFWQLANDITPHQNAKRLYPIFGLLGNVGVLLSGASLSIIPKVVDKVFSTHGLTEAAKWKASLNVITVEIMVFFVVIALAYSECTKEIHKLHIHVAKKAGKKKEKLTFSESMKLVFNSKYLGLIAILVLAYGITINFVDATFKNQVKMLFPLKSDMLNFYGKFSSFTGAATILLMIIGNNITRIYSWFTCAIIMPVVMFIAGTLFFLFIIFKSTFATFFGWGDSFIVKSSVIIGATLIIIARAAKYSLFDPSKERAYIPLEENLKLRGKAAVDGVGGRLGKSGGGLIQQAFFILKDTSSQITIAPYLGGLLVILTVSWMYAVGSLSKMFEKAIKEHKTEN